MAFNNKNIISIKCTWSFLAGIVHQTCSHKVLVNVQILNAEIKHFADTILTAWRHIPLCWLSRCRVTNYINHPREICEDVFVMMQLISTMAWAHSFYSNAVFQTLFHVLLCCCKEICLESFLQLMLKKKHVQFLPPAALEATHTCSQSSRQFIHFCSEI